MESTRGSSRPQQVEIADRGRPRFTCVPRCAVSRNPGPIGEDGQGATKRGRRSREGDEETTLVVSAWNLSGPILAELSQFLGSTRLVPESVEPDEDEEFIRDVWQEVGDDLRDAMRRYPLGQAAADAGKGLVSLCRMNDDVRRRVPNETDSGSEPLERAQPAEVVEPADRGWRDACDAAAAMRLRAPRRPEQRDEAPTDGEYRSGQAP